MGDFPRDHRATLKGDPATGGRDMPNPEPPTPAPGTTARGARSFEHPHRKALPSEIPGQTSFPPPPAFPDEQIPVNQ